LSKNHAYPALFAGVLALTVSPLFVRWAQAPGIITSFYRMLIAWLVLSPFFLMRAKKSGWPEFKHAIYPIGAGIFSALDHGFWSTAIEQTTVANATLLNNISPIWVAAFAMIVWRQRLNNRFWLGLVAILAGASLVLGSTILIRPNLVRGDYLAIISSFFYAGFFLLTQKGRDTLGTATFLWVMLLTSAVCLGFMARGFALPLIGYTQPTYVVFLTAALVSQLGAYLAITYALGKLPASIVTPTMVAQPVLTALLAIPITGEALLSGQIVGGAITLTGIYVVNVAQARSAIKLQLTSGQEIASAQPATIEIAADHQNTLKRTSV